jgi:hypothetical protein
MKAVGWWIFGIGVAATLMAGAAGNGLVIAGAILIAAERVRP